MLFGWNSSNPSGAVTRRTAAWDQGHKSAAMTLDTYADLFDKDAEAVTDAHDQRVAGFGPATNAAKTQPKGEGGAGIRLSVSS